MNAGEKFRRTVAVEGSMVGDRFVLYDERTGAATVLNPTGSRLWKSLEVARGVADFAAELQAEFPALDAGQAEADARAFLESLREADLVEPA